MTLALANDLSALEGLSAEPDWRSEQGQILGLSGYLNLHHRQSNQHYPHWGCNWGQGTTAITTAIAAGVIVDADVNASAAIAYGRRSARAVVPLPTWRLDPASDLATGTVATCSIGFRFGDKARQLPSLEIRHGQRLLEPCRL